MNLCSKSISHFDKLFVTQGTPKSELQWNAKTVIVLQCFHLTLILTWTFHEASSKNWKKSFIAFQCKGRTL